MSTFPPQQSLSIKETLNISLPDFIDHSEGIYLTVRDLFETQSTHFNPSVLDKFKAGSEFEKGIAAEIAYYHNQCAYGEQCVDGVSDTNALCKRSFLLIEDTKLKAMDKLTPIKDEAECKAFNEGDCNMKFVLIEYNFERSGRTGDHEQIKTLMADTLAAMKALIGDASLHWRFHLIYASLLARVTLDNTPVDAQIETAKQKAGGNVDAQYWFQCLLGDIYVQTRQWPKATECLRKANTIFGADDGYACTRLLYAHLKQAQHSEALALWDQLSAGMLAKGGVSAVLLDAIQHYIVLAADANDEANNAWILNTLSSDEAANEGIAYFTMGLKCFVQCWTTEIYAGEKRFTIGESAEYMQCAACTIKGTKPGKSASAGQRFVSTFMQGNIDMFSNNDMEDYDMQGRKQAATFSTYVAPLNTALLDVLAVESFFLGLFKLKFNADCRASFASAIACNCRYNMTAYVGEVMGFQNAGMMDVAVQKINEIKQFVKVSALELFPIDAKRKSEDVEDHKVAETELIAVINQSLAAQDPKYDAFLALADLYLFQGKYVPSLLLLQQCVEQKTAECYKNLTVRMKYATALFFNGYYRQCMRIFDEYMTKNLAVTDDRVHEYYVGVASHLYYKFGKISKVFSMAVKKKKLDAGNNLWLNTYQCYRHWVEKTTKKTKKRNTTKGKNQYDKASDFAKKLMREYAENPMGYALYARCLVGIPSGAKKIEEHCAKAAELADELLDAPPAENSFLTHELYYEAMLHCGVALNLANLDGAEDYFAKADGVCKYIGDEQPLLRLQREKFNRKFDNGEDNKKTMEEARVLHLEIEAYMASDANKKSYPEKVVLHAFSMEAVVALADGWKLNARRDIRKDVQGIGDAVSMYGGAGGAKKKKSKKAVAAAAAEPESKSAEPAAAASVAVAAESKAMEPDTDDNKEAVANSGGGAGAPAAADDSGGAAAADDDGGGELATLDTPFNFYSLVTAAFPAQSYVSSLPFDDLRYMTDYFMYNLLEVWAEEFGPKPTPDNPYQTSVDNIVWGSQSGLQMVLDEYAGKTDTKSIGLLNFAYMFKVEDGFCSEEHMKIVEGSYLDGGTKSFEAEGKIGFAVGWAMQCRTDEAVAEIAGSGADPFLVNKYTGFVFLMSENYAKAVTFFEKAFALNQNNPQLIAWYLCSMAKCMKSAGGDDTVINAMTPKMNAVFAHLLQSAQVTDESAAAPWIKSEIECVQFELLNVHNQDFEFLYSNLSKFDADNKSVYIRARKFICQSRCESEYNALAQTTLKTLKDEMTSKSPNIMIKICISYFYALGVWVFTQSLKNISDAMTDAGMVCMDWAEGNMITALSFAMKNDFDTGSDMLASFAIKSYHPALIAGMGGISKFEDIIMCCDCAGADGGVKSFYIGFINHLRFSKDEAKQKEAVTHIELYLTQFEFDFEGLIIAADIYLSKGAVMSAYNIYYIALTKHYQSFKENSFVRMKFAECLRMMGHLNLSYNEYRYLWVHYFSAKGMNTQIKAWTNLFLGFAFLCLLFGDFVTCNAVLKWCDKKSEHKIFVQSLYDVCMKGGSKCGAKAYKELIKFNKSDQYRNVFVLSLAVCCTILDSKADQSQVAELKAKVDKIVGEIAAKHKGINSQCLRDYCNVLMGNAQLADIAPESKNLLTCLLATKVMEQKEDIKSIVDELNKVHETGNRFPAAKELETASGLAMINSDHITLTDTHCDISLLPAPQFEEKEFTFEAIKKFAENEMKGGGGAAKGGGKKKGKKKGKKGGKKGKKGGKKGGAKADDEKKSDDSGGAAAAPKVPVSAGPKPTVDYSNRQEIEQFVVAKTQGLPQPAANKVVGWSNEEVANFIACIPIYGLNEWYANKIRESGIDGKTFLSASKANLQKWGIERLCHRGRIIAEVRAMKMRG